MNLVPPETFPSIAPSLTPSLSGMFNQQNIAGAPQPNPLQPLQMVQPFLNLSSMISSLQRPAQFIQPTQQPAQQSAQGVQTTMGTAPGYDGWTLPKGTAGGVLNPLPTYTVGTGPTMASMGYTTPNAKWANPSELSRMPAQYEPFVQEAARLYHMDPNLIKAIMRAESNFNPNDVSPVGAVGLMQLMPSTAADAGITNAQRYDPRMNILAATRYIRNIYDKYQNWPLTLAAYNAGPNRRAIRSGQIPNIQETRDYVRRVMALWGMEW